jgi:hypothetical protein
MNTLKENLMAKIYKKINEQIEHLISKKNIIESTIDMGVFCEKTNVS